MRFSHHAQTFRILHILCFSLHNGIRMHYKDLRSAHNFNMYHNSLLLKAVLLTYPLAESILDNDIRVHFNEASLTNSVHMHHIFFPIYHPEVPEHP